MFKVHAVVTTIQSPTDSIMELASCLDVAEGRLIVVGDKKGPPDFKMSEVTNDLGNGLMFMDVETQLASEFEIAGALPFNHYSRKNIGYLQAMAEGADCIYETDDDNSPLDDWHIRDSRQECRTIGVSSEVEVGDEQQWVNVYKHFSDTTIWPRGLPLDQIHIPVEVADEAVNCWVPIQQGLANGSPDVDAIWRLVLDTEFTFNNNTSVMVKPGQWCPFNTQSTWWWPAVYPLLYIPSNCSFRMCDIWKSFIAQRCLWEMGTGVVFHAAEVYQERNPHNLMRDFADEVVGYQQNDRIAHLLADIELESGVESVEHNLLLCYELLIDNEIFPTEEMTLLNHWLRDLNKIRQALDS